MIAPTLPQRKQPHGCVRTQRELAPDARGTGNATESSMSSVRAIDDVKYAVERVHSSSAGAVFVADGMLMAC